MRNDEKALLLGLAGSEVSPLLFALNAFASECEREGDACNYVPILDALAARVRELDELNMEFAREWVKAIGGGRYRARPQG